MGVGKLESNGGWVCRKRPCSAAFFAIVGGVYFEATDPQPTAKSTTDGIFVVYNQDAGMSHAENLLRTRGSRSLCRRLDRVDALHTPPRHRLRYSPTGNAGSLCHRST